MPDPPAGLEARPPPSLPTLVVIGAMKCATSALHRYLDSHPDVAMSAPKELNFFNGPEVPPHDEPDRWWVEGQWHRGVAWYGRQFDASAPLRGESSPAYTSPDFPESAARMAQVAPDVRLLYLVREPFERAMSQYAHHRTDGTERRPVEEALLDPESHYLARSRYRDRLDPFLQHFGADQVHVVVQERLLHRPRHEMRRALVHVGADPSQYDPVPLGRVNTGGARPPAPEDLRRRFLSAVADDVECLRAFMNDRLVEWS
jgi:Sulfotransferase family